MKLRQCDATVRANRTVSNHPSRDNSRAQREKAVLNSYLRSEVTRVNVIQELLELIK